MKTCSTVEPLVRDAEAPQAREETPPQLQTLARRQPFRELEDDRAVGRGDAQELANAVDDLDVRAEVLEHERGVDEVDGARVEARQIADLERAVRDVRVQPPRLVDHLG